jgi:hypothetical protein
LDTKSNRTVRLRSVTLEKNGLLSSVKSPSKEKRDEGMKLQFEKIFEEQLQKILIALHSRGREKS